MFSLCARHACGRAGGGAALGAEKRHALAQSRDVPLPSARYHSNALLLGGVRRAIQAKKTGQAALCGEPAAVSAMLCIALTGPALGCRADAAPAACRCHAYKPCGHPGMGDGLWNIVLAGAGALAAFFLCARIGERQPIGRQRCRLLCRATAPCGFCCPAFLGVSLALNMVVSVLQRMLAIGTRYQIPTAVQLPEGRGAMVLYFIGICGCPPWWKSCLCAARCSPCLRAGGLVFHFAHQCAVYADARRHCANAGCVSYLYGAGHYGTCLRLAAARYGDALCKQLHVLLLHMGRTETGWHWRAGPYGISYAGVLSGCPFAPALF